MNLSAPFIMQVSPLMAVLMKTMPIIDVFFGYVTATFTGTGKRKEKDVRPARRSLTPWAKTGGRSHPSSPFPKRGLSTPTELATSANGFLVQCAASAYAASVLVQQSVTLPAKVCGPLCQGGPGEGDAERSRDLRQRDQGGDCRRNWERDLKHLNATAGESAILSQAPPCWVPVHAEELSSRGVRHFESGSPLLGFGARRDSWLNPRNCEGSQQQGVRHFEPGSSLLKCGSDHGTSCMMCWCR